MIVSRVFLVIFFSLVLLSASGQSTQFKLSGKVRQPDRQPFPGVTVYIQDMKLGTTTDANGNYSLRLPAGIYSIEFSFVGYVTKTERVTISSSQFLNASLVEELKQLEAVEVTSQVADHNVKSMEIGVNKMEIQAIKKLPAFMGEVDVMKSLLLLPGVTTVGEGTSNINVRGGNSDQNLILMDDAPVFNPSHLMGLFSIFNADMTKNITLYRGSVPAQFGGRASSVLDIGLRSPNTEKINVEGGIGLIANRLLVEGPIIKDKLSFIVGGRLSYPDYLFSLVKSLKDTEANFYDLTTRLEYTPNANNKFYFSGYLSSDRFKPAGDSLSANTVNGTSAHYEWQTRNATLGWLHSFSDKFSFKLAGILSHYNSNIGSSEPTTSYNLRSTVQFASVKSDFSYQTDRHHIQFGGEANHYTISPGTLTPGSEASSVAPVILANEQSVELAGFAADEFKINKWITLIYGLRYSYYYNLGPSDVYGYDPSKPRSIETIQDTTHYTSGQVIKTYGGLEPRASLKFDVGERTSVKLGYSRLRQYIQRITNTTSALPTDRWQTSNTYIRPMVSDQVSLGVFRNFFDNGLEASVEVYAKKITDISDYKDGANLLLNPATETAILQGDGRAAGVEFQLKKNRGKVTGWINYTYSQTEILINGADPTEKINNGKWYPANYNKPNNLNIVFNYAISKRTSFSANFTYSTGRPVTYAANNYYVGTIPVPNYTNRNQDKIPDYHRLDVSLTVEPNPLKKTRIKGTWVFSIYNLYARANAFSVYTQTITPTFNSTYKLSIFGTIFPSITYNFKIGK